MAGASKMHERGMQSDQRRLFDNAGNSYEKKFLTGQFVSEAGGKEQHEESELLRTSYSSSSFGMSAT
jgi:hypothetical protein